MTSDISKKLYEAYGDESCDAETICYAMFLIKSPMRSVLEENLIQIKKNFGGNELSVLHCLHLFGENGRKKTGWGHLDTSDVLLMLKDLFDAVNEVEAQVIACKCKADILPKNMPPYEMRSINGEPQLKKEGYKMQSKNLSMTCGGAVKQYICNKVGVFNVEFILDPETTLISPFNRGSGAVLKTGWVDVGMNLPPVQATVRDIEGQKPVLLEIADCIAYVLRKSYTFSFSPIGPSLRKLRKKLSPFQMEITRKPEGIGFELPTDYGI